MSFDGIVTRAVVHELINSLVGGRVNKVYQLSEYELILHIRAQGKNQKLYISANPASPRFQLTETTTGNPKEPPMFCMLLRKHIDGGIIQGIRQLGMERIVQIDIRGRNDLGDEVIRRLIIEIMGRHSNIILIDVDSGKILDSMRRVNHSVSQVRQVLPGLIYQLPPEQNKIDPFQVDQTQFISGFDYNSGRLDKQLMNRFTGLGPLIAKEIIYRAGIGNRERLWETFHNLMQQIEKHQYQPTSIELNNKSIFYAINLTHLEGNPRFYTSMSDCLEAYYYGKAERDRVRGQTLDLIKRLTHEIEKNEKKIVILQQELTDSERAEEEKIKGELLTTYMHQIKNKASSVKLINYYDPEGAEIEITLDPLLSPSQNAQRYFKRYTKRKVAKKYNLEQIQIAQEENHYLESVLVQLENSSLNEVEQIREELEEQGWLRTQKKQVRRKKEKPLPTTVYATDGTIILVGKNNKQNDYLTHQLAHSSETWLHTKDIPGSHVVIRSRDINEQTLHEAAMLSAYFSKARESSQVPVDYTLVKHVKKPSGARPGFVIYENQQTLYVTPDEKQIRELLTRTKESAIQ